LLGFSCLEEGWWAGVAGEETETRTIDLNINTNAEKDNKLHDEKHKSDLPRRK